MEQAGLRKGNPAGSSDCAAAGALTSGRWCILGPVGLPVLCGGPLLLFPRSPKLGSDTCRIIRYLSGLLTAAPRYATALPNWVLSYLFWGSPGEAA